MTYPAYKFLEANVDYLYNAYGFTVDQIATKLKIPTLVIADILNK